MKKQKVGVAKMRRWYEEVSVEKEFWNEGLKVFESRGRVEAGNYFRHLGLMPTWGSFMLEKMYQVVEGPDMLGEYVVVYSKG
jgi:hypothetical protein